jgi:hypothetical protein
MPPQRRVNYTVQSSMDAPSESTMPLSVAAAAAAAAVIVAAAAAAAVIVAAAAAVVVAAVAGNSPLSTSSSPQSGEPQIQIHQRPLTFGLAAIGRSSF